MHEKAKRLENQKGAQIQGEQNGSLYNGNLFGNRQYPLGDNAIQIDPETAQNVMRQIKL